jgi:nicotinamidase-related amidase
MPTISKRTGTALILVDLVDIDFNQKNRPFRAEAMRAATHIASLKSQARKSGIPTVFANDHFGDWHSSFRELVMRCVVQGGDAASLVKTVKPDKKDYSILKPRHSAFYGTPLMFLLEELKVKRLILTGIQADVCVMFTANDAYIRKFDLWVPRNCVAASTASKLRQSLRFMKDNLNADVRPWRK